MDTSTFDFDTITLMVTIAGSWLTLVGVIIFQTSRLDTKFDKRFDDLNTKVGKLETTIAPIDTRSTASTPASTESTPASTESTPASTNWRPGLTLWAATCRTLARDWPASRAT